jgi:hypothetical protein
MFQWYRDDDRGKEPSCERNPYAMGYVWKRSNIRRISKEEEEEVCTRRNKHTKEEEEEGCQIYGVCHHHSTYVVLVLLTS